MPSRLSSSPDLFPFDIDVAGARVRMLRLDEAVYREASFLDGRILPEERREEWWSVSDVNQSHFDGDRQLNYIFHLGHVGSTLLSRLLESSKTVFSIREPLIFRRLAAFELALGLSFNPWPAPYFHERLDAVIKLLARVYRRPQTSLVKTTSLVSEMAPLLMSRTPGSRAILLFARPQIYIASILAGDASRSELPDVSPERLARIRRRFPTNDWRLQSFTEGELAALGWTCELLGLAETARRFPDQSLWLDFDRFLAEPREELARVLEHLNGETSVGELETILTSPDFGRYSKATERFYDSALRQNIISEAITQHATEIERGMAWINSAGLRYPIIAAAARAAAAAMRR